MSQALHAVADAVTDFVHDTNANALETKRQEHATLHKLPLRAVGMVYNSSRSN